MELLIRVVDKQPLVSVISEVSSQRGDLIAAVQDGWAWSQAERNNPHWIIIQCDLVEAEVQALLEPGRINEPKWRRRLGVNVDGLQSGDVITRKQLMARVF